MNVFILNTGRCGSTTFIRACQHISNFTSAHESRCHQIGEDRFDYPDNHIEADNRLAWFLGRLDRHYGDKAVYVHLKRNSKDTASSYAKRMFSGGIIPAYRQGIIQFLPDEVSDMSVCLDYYDTVNSNIELFLKDKSRQMAFNLENAQQDFQKFWTLIGAEGDIAAALSEFNNAYNASEN
jgi:hypothetical protein